MSQEKINHDMTPRDYLHHEAWSRLNAMWNMWLVVELLMRSFQFTLRKRNVRVIMIMKFEILKRHILKPTLSTDMVQRLLWWERHKRRYGRNMQGPMVEKCCYNNFVMIFLGEEKETVKHFFSSFSFFFFSKL